MKMKLCGCIPVRPLSQIVAVLSLAWGLFLVVAFVERYNLRNDDLDLLKKIEARAVEESNRPYRGDAPEGFDDFCLLHLRVFMGGIQEIYIAGM